MKKIPKCIVWVDFSFMGPTPSGTAWTKTQAYVLKIIMTVTLNMNVFLSPLSLASYLHLAVIYS